MKFQSTIAACMALFTMISALPQAPSVPLNCPFGSDGEQTVGSGNKTQFITQRCLSDADCKVGCCTGPCGICSNIGACFQALGGTGLVKTGCGFPLPPDGSTKCETDRSSATDVSGSNKSGGGNGNNGGNSSQAGVMTSTAAAAAAPACTA